MSRAAHTMVWRSACAVAGVFVRSTPIANDSYQGFVEGYQGRAYGTAHCARTLRSGEFKSLKSFNCAVRSVPGVTPPSREVGEGLYPWSGAHAEVATRTPQEIGVIQWRDMVAGLKQATENDLVEYDGQPYRFLGVGQRTNRHGDEVGILAWRGRCPVCGAAFEFYTPPTGRTNPARRCRDHANPGIRLRGVEKKRAMAQIP